MKNFLVICDGASACCRPELCYHALPHPLCFADRPGPGWHSCAYHQGRLTRIKGKRQGVPVPYLVLVKEERELK